MIELDELDDLIEKLSAYLESIQNEDGSFDTMFNRPVEFPEKGWMKWPGNSPVDTATALIPLLYIKSALASEVIEKGNRFFLETGLDQKYWGFADRNKTSVTPFDTESTSQCSYVLSQSGHKVRNKKFLDTLINEENNYWLLINPKRLTFNISVLTWLKIYIRNRKHSFAKVSVLADDWEFSTNCNNLLYIGKSEKNKNVWNSVAADFNNFKIQCVYYNLRSAVYFYSRLFCYGRHEELMPPAEILDKYVSLLEKQSDTDTFSLDSVLLANTLLFFGLDVERYKNIYDHCFNDLACENYKQVTTYFSSHNVIDYDKETGKHNTLFGSNAITCSLYLEFLNLYRMRIFGSYYVE